MPPPREITLSKQAVAASSALCHSMRVGDALNKKPPTFLPGALPTYLGCSGGVSLTDFVPDVTDFRCKRVS